MLFFKLLFILFACFSPTINAASLTKNESKRMIGTQPQSQAGEKVYKVLILGAGMAGITAAKTLHDAGITDFLVLEAKDRIGGRLFKKDFPGAGGGVVELGANWVHGTDCNPIWDLVKEAKLDGVDTMIKPNEEGEGKYVVLNENGEDVTKFDGHKELKTKEACLEELIENLKAKRQPDIPMRAALDNCGGPPKNTAERAIEYFCHDFDAAVSPEHVSCGVKLRSDGAIDSEDDRQFIISDRRGYETIIWNMAEEFYKDKIRVNHLVEKIVRAKDVVQVTVNGIAKPMLAEFVLVTFSIGVLQKYGGIFNPPLPPQFQLSLNKIQMANYLKIFLKFKKRFWYPQFDYIFYASEIKRGYYPVWQNLPGTQTNIPENDNILLVTATGEEADRLRDDNVLIQKELLPILEKVNHLAANSLQHELIGIELKNWRLDEQFLGAYSNPTVGTTRAHFDTLAKPVGERMYFAGEGTSQLYYGFAHGAYLTGQDQAEKIITVTQYQETVNSMTMKKTSAA